jgi:hypothetical protein
MGQKGKKRASAGRKGSDHSAGARWTTNQQIAKRLETRTARVSKWRQRFGALRLVGLSDLARSGKPIKYDQNTEKRVLALLDEPAPKGYAQWNGRLLAEALPKVTKDQV